MPIIFSLLASNAYAREATQWDKKLVRIANQQGIPAPLLSAICWVESHHQPHATNWDDNGSASLGMCQIKFNTAVDMGYSGSIEGLFDGATNAKFAARYIKYQLKRYHNNWASAAAAYNAGRVVTCSKSRLYFVVSVADIGGMVEKRRVPCVEGEFLNQKYVNSVLDSILK